ncbi:MAG: hypothetical protein J0I16_22185 [Rhizobiales bacterium]|nr:hypothetical protein [Hyphomicrobiales bacterium]
MPEVQESRVLRGFVDSVPIIGQQRLPEMVEDDWVKMPHVASPCVETMDLNHFRQQSRSNDTPELIEVNDCFGTIDEIGNDPMIFRKFQNRIVDR